MLSNHRGKAMNLILLVYIFLARTTAAPSRGDVYGEYSPVLELARDLQPTSQPLSAHQLQDPRGAYIKDSDIPPPVTFIPPPAKDITPELLNESLSIQRQDTAAVGSVIPHFSDNVISFHVQLNGFIAPTIVLNTSTSLPCAGIDSSAVPSLMLVPKAVKDASTTSVNQIVVSDCLVVAANMYNPTTITYWVTNEEGEVLSLLGDNKIHGMDRIDTSSSIALSLVPISLSAQFDRRSAGAYTDVDVATPTSGTDHYRIASELRARAVLRVACDSRCPPSPYTIRRMSSNEGNFCGCLMNETVVSNKLGVRLEREKRGMLQTDSHNAVMTADACRAMQCLGNGGKPAIYNPFRSTCFCMEPVYTNVHPTTVGS